jgi:hypothetical protein
MKTIELNEKNCREVLKKAEGYLSNLGKLITAVIEQAGCGSYMEAVYFFLDVAHDGACMGAPGFTYYKDTVDFFDRYRIEIVSLITFDMIGSSDCRDVVKYLQSGSKLSDYQTMLLSLVLAGKDEGEDQNEVMDIKNDLVWFVLDVIADIVHGFVYKE